MNFSSENISTTKLENEKFMWKLRTNWKFSLDDFWKLKKFSASLIASSKHQQKQRNTLIRKISLEFASVKIFDVELK